MQEREREGAACQFEELFQFRQCILLRPTELSESQTRVFRIFFGAGCVCVRLEMYDA